MSNASRPEWAGPIALFVGFSAIFFGGIWMSYLMDQSSSAWMGYAKSGIITTGVILVSLGINWTLKRGNDE